MSDIITITETDLAGLQSWEFEEVWRSIGYVFRQRAKASKTLPAVPPATEPAPVPLAPVDAPPDVLPGRAPGEVSKRAGVEETPRTETFVMEPPAPAAPGPPAHLHRYKLGRPHGELVEGVCECGHRKLHPADPGAGIAINGKNHNPKCAECGKPSLKDRHGYWCNGCQLEVKAS